MAHSRLFKQCARKLDGQDLRTRAVSASRGTGLRTSRASCPVSGNEAILSQLVPGTAAGSLLSQARGRR